MALSNVSTGIIPTLKLAAVLRTQTLLQDSKQGSQELRNLQRKNVELSSLVRKLDEKNQHLSTKNAELVNECMHFSLLLCMRTSLCNIGVSLS